MMTGIRFVPPVLYRNGSGSVFAIGRSFPANLHHGFDQI
jgi:hypothetical protein